MSCGKQRRRLAKGARRVRQERGLAGERYLDTQVGGRVATHAEAAVRDCLLPIRQCTVPEVVLVDATEAFRCLREEANTPATRSKRRCSDTRHVPPPLPPTAGRS